MLKNIVKSSQYASTFTLRKPDRVSQYLCKSIFPVASQQRDVTTSPRLQLYISEHGGVFGLFWESTKDVARFFFGGQPENKTLDPAQFQLAIAQSVPWLRQQHVQTLLQTYRRPAYTYNDFQNVYTNVVGYRETMNGVLATQFRQWDTMGIGKVSPNYFATWLGTMGYQVNPSMLATMDLDRDGLITLADAERFFWSNPSINPFNTRMPSNQLVMGPGLV